MSYTIEGLDGLLDDLEGLGEETAQSAMMGLEKGMKRTVAVAKVLVPTDTGELKNSITSYVEANGDTIEGTIAATAGHAVFVEMGTGDRGEASDNGKAEGATYTHGHAGQEAQPYLYPAYLQTKALIKHDVQGAINEKLGGG